MNELEIDILCLVSDSGPAGVHGYAIRKELRAHLPVPISSVSRVLKRLRSSGLLCDADPAPVDVPKDVRPVKRYRLTDSGRAHLAALAAQTKAVLGHLKGALAGHAATGASASPSALEPTASPLSLYFDLDEFTPAEIVEMIDGLSALYESVGGDELVIDDVTILDPAEVLEPVGGGL